MAGFDKILEESTKGLRPKALLPAKSDLFKNEHKQAKAILQQINKELPKPLSKRVTRGAIEKSYNNFEDAIGGRQALIDSLTHAPESISSLKHVQKLLNDPDFALPSNYPLFTLCSRHHVPLSVIVQSFRDSKIAQLNAQAIARLSEHAPVIVDQLAEDAQNKLKDCHVCGGSARIRRIGEDGEWLLDENKAFITQLCHNCRGTGRIHKDHTPESRKQFLEITGILDRKRLGGTEVNINQQVGFVRADFTPGDGTFEKLIKAIDTISGKKTEEEDIIDVPFTVYDNIEETNKSNEDSSIRPEESAGN